MEATASPIRWLTGPSGERRKPTEPPFPRNPAATAGLSIELQVETFPITPDGRRLVVSYQQATRSLVTAEGVPEVKPPNRRLRFAIYGS